MYIYIYIYIYICIHMEAAASAAPRIGCGYSPQAAELEYNNITVIDILI